MINPGKEREEKWAAEKRLHFARYCWLRRFNYQGDKQWGTIFFEKEGISLGVFAAQRKKAKLAETHRQKKHTQLEML